MVPDVITGAKGLANGLPVGVTTARPEIAESIRFLTLSTFGGNPVSMVAAKAVLDFVEEESLLQHCAEVGAYLKQHLLELQEKYSLMGEVSRMPLLQAIKLVEERQSKEPAGEEAALMDVARRHGLLIGKGGLVQQRDPRYAADEHKPKRRGGIRSAVG